ncbi:hypothetical protein HPP92_013232 [Vanilla planifolia]|uniref:Uncharacterized protein n=1 Tax=Vanilla planifolia TaxID=51239 RepID=A0A835QN15_VANPL|nr:hypothetical protein HPP92_013232 [Vanilla planifolia]
MRAAWGGVKSLRRIGLGGEHCSAAGAISGVWAGGGDWWTPHGLDAWAFRCGMRERGATAMMVVWVVREDRAHDLGWGWLTGVMGREGGWEALVSRGAEKITTQMGRSQRGLWENMPPAGFSSHSVEAMWRGGDSVQNRWRACGDGRVFRSDNATGGGITVI